jgi:hypothetical protein
MRWRLVKGDGGGIDGGEDHSGSKRRRFHCRHEFIRGPAPIPAIRPAPIPAIRVEKSPRIGTWARLAEEWGTGSATKPNGMDCES